MRFSVLASGSRANCTVIETPSACVLIDCGLSAREAVKRMSLQHIDPARLTAILVTHEHRDHIAGVPVLSRRHRIPVYANAATAAYLDDVYALEVFDGRRAFELSGLCVEPFSVAHDAEDPVGYTLSYAGAKLVYATDLGRVTHAVRRAASGCNALILEFNHDRDLLRDCGYPWPLKQRIASSHGHLCNSAAAALIAELMHRDLAHVVLGHISENSNTPETAYAALQAAVDTDRFVSCRCAGPYRPTPLVRVDSEVCRGAA